MDRSTSCSQMVTHVATRLMEQPGVVFDARDWTLARGSAGWSLFLHLMDAVFPQQGWKTRAEYALARTLSLLTRADAVSSVPLGMFTGLTGVCTHLDWLARTDEQYRPLQTRLDALLFERVLHAYHEEQAHLLQGVTFVDYDVINGLAGIGSYALLRQDLPQARLVLTMTIERFLFLSAPSDRVRGHGRFFIPPERSPHATFLHRYPHGATDLGLAHGLPGPLAFLALVLLSGWGECDTEAVRAGVAHMVAWLSTFSLESSGYLRWPAAVPKDLQLPAPARPVWCYGAAGVAWALWLAGLALDDPAVLTLARRTMETVSSDILVERTLSSPLLCHGIAGVLLLVQGFAWTVPGDLFFRKMQDDLLCLLLSTGDPSHPTGFRGGDDRAVSSCQELLEGSVGVLACLATQIQGVIVASPLSLPFLLADDRTLPQRGGGPL